MVYPLPYEKVAKCCTIYCVLLRIPGVIKKKVTVQFLDITGSNQGKDNHERLLGLAYAIKQTRRDNGEHHKLDDIFVFILMHGLFIFCDCQPSLGEIVF